MMSLSLLPFLAIVASAQYAITDLIGEEGRSNGNVAQTSQQIPQVVGNSFSPQQAGISSQVAHTGFQRGNSPAPMNAGGAMASLLTGMVGEAGPSTAFQGSHSMDGKVLPQDSIAVVGGLVEAFMHKMKLEPGEKGCLVNNVGQLTGDIMGTVGDVVTAVKALVAGNGTVKRGTAGNLVSAGIDSAMKITSLVTLSMQLIKNCVHGDALVILNTTAHHLINGTYLGKRFLVNGIDIAHSLADSINAFESHDFHRFGVDIGFSLRKILLSKATNATRLPEGIPEQVIIQKATDGLMRGFFVSGSAVEITDKAYPDIDIVINLHQCIAGNSPFFKELWMSAWDLFAQLSANGLRPPQGQPKWQGELMVAMMQFPVALQKCGLGADMQETFTEAIKSIDDLQVAFRFPDDRFKPSDGTDRMAKAVEAWTNWDFEGFGVELGTLFRELLMLAFPQKYSVGSAGRLQRYAQIQRVNAARKGDSVLVLGCGVVALSALLTIVRARRSSPQLFDRDALACDMEDGAKSALVDSCADDLLE